MTILFSKQVFYDLYLLISFGTKNFFGNFEHTKIGLYNFGRKYI
jgi:hypothetical protein